MFKSLYLWYWYKFKNIKKKVSECKKKFYARNHAQIKYPDDQNRVYLFHSAHTAPSTVPWTDRLSMNITN